MTLNRSNPVPSLTLAFLIVLLLPPELPAQGLEYVKDRYTGFAGDSPRRNPSRQLVQIGRVAIGNDAAFA